MFNTLIKNTLVLLAVLGLTVGFAAKPIRQLSPDAPVTPHGFEFDG